MTTDLEPLLTDRTGVGLLLAVSPRTVSRLDDAGRIPAAQKLGGCKRWNVDEIKAWISAGMPPRKQWNLLNRLAAPRKSEAGQT